MVLKSGLVWGIFCLTCTCFKRRHVSGAFLLSIKLCLGLLLPPARKLPMILPHKLVCEPCWPCVDDADVKAFWNNLSANGSPLANISPDKNHIPIWLWGDEAQYRENGDEILLICMGIVVDKRKFSVESCYPLGICRSDSFRTV